MSSEISFEKCHFFHAQTNSISGALLRWFLSQFNPKYPHFPLFTFLVNVFGSVLYAIAAVSIEISQDNELQELLRGALLVGFAGGVIWKVILS